LMLRNSEIVSVEQNFDLRSGMYWPTLFEALSSLVRTEDRIINVIDKPPNMSGEWIEVTLHEAPLHVAMRTYGLNILLLSIVLSLVVAAMIYAALSRMLVRPMQKLSANMTAFGDHPEDVNRLITPSQRNDEIGTAERELRDMQTQLQGLLQQKNHLAALGLAVSKVSHDLRNMLTTAQVVSDSLATVKDPQVQRFAPRLITSLDRAINFLNQTLQYGQAREFPPQRSTINLHELTSDVFAGLDHMANGRVELHNAVAKTACVDADKEHLHRILTNLVRNALQALEGEQTLSRSDLKVSVGVVRNGASAEIEIADNGPGIPQSVRGKLFEAFQSAAKPGGTGLGLAISQELAVAHGGYIKVKHTGDTGTCFIVTIPEATASVSDIS
jgi:signal transduction histidine kinase